MDSSPSDVLQVKKVMENGCARIPLNVLNPFIFLWWNFANEGTPTIKRKEKGAKK